MTRRKLIQLPAAKRPLAEFFAHSTTQGKKQNNPEEKTSTAQKKAGTFYNPGFPQNEGLLMH